MIRIATRFGALLFASLLLSVAALAQITVEIDGNRVNFTNTQPAMIGGRVLVPLRGIMESLGATVDFEAATRTVNAARGTSALSLQIGSTTAYMDGKPITLDVPAQIVRGSTMVPLRFVGEALGAEVKWVGTTKTVKILMPSGSGTGTGAGAGTGTGSGTGVGSGALTIGSFDHSATAWLNENDRLTVTMMATPGAQASFYIPGVVDQIAMTEVEPGKYQANWPLPDKKIEQTEADNAVVIGILKQGQAERLIQAPRPIRIDGKAPVVKGVTPANGAQVADKRPSIAASYSDGAGSGIDLNTLNVTLDDEAIPARAENGLVLFQPTKDLGPGSHFVRITAKDKAGNQTVANWSFIVVDNASIVTEFTYAGPEVPEPGDVLTFTVKGEENARSVIAVIDSNRRISLLPIAGQPGTYKGDYIVRKGETFSKIVPSAVFTTANGNVVTVSGNKALGKAPDPKKPTLTSPTAGNYSNETVVVEGVAENAKQVQISIIYRQKLLGLLESNGQLANVTVEVGDDGKFKSDPISLKLLFDPRDVTYDITVVGIGESGVKSAPTSVTIKR